MSIKTKKKTSSVKGKKKQTSGLLRGFKDEAHREKFIKSLKKRDSRELLRESVEALVLNGMNYDKSARELGITTGTLRNRVKTHPEIMLSIKKMPETAKIIINSATEKASKTIVDLMDSDSELMRFNSSRDILDRAGVVKPDVSQAVQVNVFNKIKEDIDTFDV